MDAREQVVKGLKQTAEETRRQLRDVQSKAIRDTTRGSITGVSKDNERLKTKAVRVPFT